MEKVGTFSQPEGCPPSLVGMKSQIFLQILFAGFPYFRQLSLNCHFSEIHTSVKTMRITTPLAMPRTTHPSRTLTSAIPSTIKDDQTPWTTHLPLLLHAVLTHESSKLRTGQGRRPRKLRSQRKSRQPLSLRSSSRLRRRSGKGRRRGTSRSRKPASPTSSRARRRRQR